MNTKKLKDLLVKLHYVFPKDLYCINKRYILPGDKSFDDTYGRNLCILDPKWEEIFLDGFVDNIFISDITSAKKCVETDPGCLPQYFNMLQKEEIEVKTTTVKTALNIIDRIKDWTYLVNAPKIAEVLLEEKGIYELPIPDTNDIIRIGKPALPMISPKTVEKYKYHIEYDDDFGFYRIFIYLPFDYFQMYLFYNAIPLQNKNH